MTLYALLLLVFPFAVHYAYLEVITPVGLENVLLAIRALLIVGSILLLFLGLTDVILLNLHVRVKGLLHLFHCFIWFKSLLI